MGKISQAVAQQVARKIVEPINKKMIEVEEKLRVQITEWYKETVPPDILKVFKKHPEYIITISSVNIYNHGFNSRNISLVGKLPGESSWQRFELSKEQASILQPLVSEKEKLKEKYNTTIKEIENTINTLGTHKRISEQFPEIVDFCPSIKQNTSLIVQIKPLREKVKCLISNDKEKACIEKL